MILKAEQGRGNMVHTKTFPNLLPATANEIKNYSLK
jgi:hypothetical protein